MGDFYVSVEQIYNVKKNSLYNASSRQKLEEEYIEFIRLRKQVNKDIEELKERMLQLK